MSNLPNASLKKTILHIVISFDTGGLEKFVLDLIRFSANHFTHQVVCLERIGDLVAVRGLKNITCLEMKPGLQFKVFSELNTIVKKNKIDLIHTHNEKALFYGAIWGLLSGIPVIHTKHGKNQVTLKAGLRNNLLSRLCKRVIAVSRDAAYQCIHEEKIPAPKVMVIHNGVDINAFSNQAGAKTTKISLSLDAGVVIIGIVARLAAVKDHATLFRACNILKNKKIDFKLLVVGDGPLKYTLLKLVASLGLQKEIIFTGNRSDISELMCAMDIFVLSSVSEGISLTLIEAMSCNLPIVATNVGGNPEVVIDGETGYLVPPQNPEALADKLSLLIRKPDMRKTLGTSGRKRAVDFFSLRKSVMDYESCYNNVLESK